MGGSEEDQVPWGRIHQDGGVSLLFVNVRKYGGGYREGSGAREEMEPRRLFGSDCTISKMAKIEASSQCWGDVPGQHGPRCPTVNQDYI